MKPSHQRFCVRRGFTEKFKSDTNSSSVMADGAQRAECLCPQNACVVATVPCRGTKRRAGPWDVVRVRRVTRTEAAVVGLCPDRGSQSPRSAVDRRAGRGRHPVSGRCLGCGDGCPWFRLPRGTCYGGHQANVDAVARRPRRGGGRSRGASLRPGQGGNDAQSEGVSPRGYGCEEGHQRSGTRTLMSAAWVLPVTRWTLTGSPEGEAERNRQSGGEGSGRSPRGLREPAHGGSPSLPVPGPAQPCWPSSVRPHGLRAVSHRKVALLCPEPVWRVWSQAASCALLTARPGPHRAGKWEPWTIKVTARPLALLCPRGRAPCLTRAPSLLALRCSDSPWRLGTG